MKFDTGVDAESEIDQMKQYLGEDVFGNQLLDYVLGMKTFGELDKEMQLLVINAASHKSKYPIEFKQYLVLRIPEAELLS